MKEAQTQKKGSIAEKYLCIASITLNARHDIDRDDSNEPILRLNRRSDGDVFIMYMVLSEWVICFCFLRQK